MEERSLAAGASDRGAVERSAGGVVFRRGDGVVQVLLIRDPYGKWGLPKGHLEGTETTEQAALREVTEETGLVDLELGADLGEIEWTFRKNGAFVHKRCRFYLISAPRGEARPQRSEGITEVRWLPFAEAKETLSYENAREVLVRGEERLGEIG